jgi:hypothetical protein
MQLALHAPGELIPLTFLPLHFFLPFFEGIHSLSAQFGVPGSGGSPANNQNQGPAIKLT